MIGHGLQRAEEFLVALAFEDAWTSQDVEAVMAFFTDDSELVCAPPFPALGPYRGRGKIRRFVGNDLAQEVAVDLTRKRVARDRVTWMVRFDRGRGTRIEGPAEAVFDGNVITTLTLGVAAPR